MDYATNNVMGRLTLALGVVLGFLAINSALAQDSFSKKPVTMIVPFPPGGGTGTGVPDTDRQRAGALSEDHRREEHQRRMRHSGPGSIGVRVEVSLTLGNPGPS